MTSPLQRSDVVGSRIARVRSHLHFNAIDGWLDEGRVFFTLESGASFELPASSAEALQTVEVPLAARDASQWERLIGQTIVEVLRQLYRGETDSDSAVLQLGADCFVTETVVAPHGTGAVGLHVYTRGEWGQPPAHDWSVEPFWK
jgi:hypothetical protein